MNIDEAIEWLKIIKDGFYYKDLESAIKIEGYEDCEKAIETLINEYNNLKQIEETHRIENGELRKELKQEKEKNKELEEEDIKMRAKFVLSLDDYISKDKIRAKIKELEEKSDYWNCDEIEVLKELLEN